MKKTRFTEAQIMGILRQMESARPFPSFAANMA